MFGGLDDNIMKYLGGAQPKSSYTNGLDQALNTMWGSPSLFNLKQFKLQYSHGGIFGVNLQTLNASILNVETATITETPIEEWIGGQWVYTHGRPEMRQITFTFRDTSNSWLYRNFNTAKNQIRNLFPDEQKWVLQVDTHSPLSDGVNSKGRFSNTKFNASDKFKGLGTLIYTNAAILESISSVSLDQSNSDGFLTFSVTFKYINPQHNLSYQKGTTGVAENPLGALV